MNDMKKYIIPLLFVLLFSVSCKKPDEFYGASDRERITLKVLSVEATSANLIIECSDGVYFGYSDYKQLTCTIIDKKTGRELNVQDVINYSSHTVSLYLPNLQRNTKYSVCALLYERDRSVAIISNDVNFTTK